MICKNCNHELQGGFKQEDGSFLCTACVIYKIEKETNRDVLDKSIKILETSVATNHRPTKKEIREALNHLRAIVAIHFKER